MFCVKCGAELSEGALFCDKCGKKVRKSKREIASIKTIGNMTKDILKGNIGKCVIVAVALVILVSGIYSVSCHLIGKKQQKIVDFVKNYIPEETGKNCSYGQYLEYQHDTVYFRYVDEEKETIGVGVYMKEVNGELVTCDIPSGPDVDFVEARCMDKDESGQLIAETLIVYYFMLTDEGNVSFLGTAELEGDKMAWHGYDKQLIQTISIVYPENEIIGQDIITTTQEEWQNAYKKIIKEAEEVFPAQKYFSYYSLFDVDKDGVPELFLKTGTCEADYQFEIYSFYEKSNRAEVIDVLSGSHSSLCGFGDESAFLLHSGHQGYEVITKYTYKNGKIKEEELFSGLVENYHNTISVPYYQLNDYTGLEWMGNIPDDNQRVLDNSALINGEQLTNSNFEEKVFFVKRDAWYDNGVFRGFLDWYGLGDTVNVEDAYLGTNITAFSVPEYGWTEFDIYKIVADDGWCDYYFVPIGEYGAPTVYRFVEGAENLVWVWSGVQ